MSKAKKKRGKSISAITKVTNAEAALYNLEIEASEKKIARLRKHFKSLDTSNEEIKERIRSLKCDQKDKAGDLTREFNSLDQTYYEYNEQYQTLIREFNNLKSQSEAAIYDQEYKYKAMHNQLTSEIKLLKSKFQMISDYREKPEMFYEAIQMQNELFEAKIEECKNLIESKEWEIKDEKQSYLREFKEQLYQVSSDFTRASALKSSPYSQRLIRENIALDKENDIMERTLTMMEQKFKDHMEHCEKVKRDYPKLNKKKCDLIFMAQKKHEKIARLTNKFENLRKAYIDSLIYKNQFDDMIQYENYKTLNKRNVVTQIKKLASRAHTLKAECQYMENKQKHNDIEIGRLCKFISSIKTTLLEALGIYDHRDKYDKRPKQSLSNRSDVTGYNWEESTEEQSSSSTEQNTQNLLETLIQILRDIQTEVGSFDSFENVSVDSFVLRCKNVFSHSSEAIRALRESESKIQSEKSEEPSLAEIHGRKIDLLNVIPTERSEHAYIFEVEEGTSYYISSGRSDQLIVEKEESKKDDDEEEQSSIDENEQHSDTTAAPEQGKEPEPITGIVVQKKSDLYLMPPGTIIDVNIEEEEEEEDEPDFVNHTFNAADDESFDGEEEISQLMFY